MSSAGSSLIGSGIDVKTAFYIVDLNAVASLLNEVSADPGGQ